MIAVLVGLLMALALLVTVAVVTAVRLRTSVRALRVEVEQLGQRNRSR